MNRLSWICARRKKVFEMSGKTDDPAKGGLTPWKSDWRRHVQWKHYTSKYRKMATETLHENNGYGIYSYENECDELQHHHNQEKLERRAQ